MYIKTPTTIKLIFFILFLISSSVVAQNIDIKTISETFTIQNDKSFVKNVEVHLKESNHTIGYPIFYDDELESIADIKIWIKKGNKFIVTKKNNIKEDIVELDYITSKKVKTVSIPPNTETKITYSITCPQLMYLTHLSLFSNDNIDTLKYQINIPKEYYLSHNSIYLDSLKYFQMDSIQEDTYTKWKIKTTPVKLKPNLLTYFGVYEDIKVPMIRTLILPYNQKNNGQKYMNDWYLRETEKQKGLSAEVMMKIDNLTKGITDSEEVIKILYDYVRNNFKYVAIEIGMGAFIPTRANDVYKNKEGDCKDLSNFLSEALNYKGIKSDIALAATYSHISDCDFPSLSSANHVICVAYTKDKQILLDPTDQIHIPETPIESIQDRSIFIINNEGGQFYKTPKFDPKQNAINYQIDLKADSLATQLTGKFKVTYKGTSGNYLRSQFHYADEDTLTIGNKHYQTTLGNQPISNLSIKSNSGVLEAEGSLTIKDKIYSDGDNLYVFVDYLPRLIETETRETILEGTFLGSAFNKVVTLRITMEEALENYEPVEYTSSSKGVEFNLKITTPTAQVIECQYEFLLDYIFIEKESINAINEVLKSFKKISNEPIILHRKRD